MPYVFQEEITTPHPHQTGCEKFDSLYKLYDIFKDPSYFLINLFFGAHETISANDIKQFLISTAQKYQISHYVVRCEKQSETQPVPAVAFADITTNAQRCAEYIQDKLTSGYNCIVHEVIPGLYPSNRLDWLYSFGICYKDFLPHIEIYPATDASSIKWGKLSPLDLISLDNTLNVIHTKIREEKDIARYQETKINEWVKQFQKELDDNFQEKNLFTNFQNLYNQLKSVDHPLFDMKKIDTCIHQTKQKLIDIALKYSSYAQTNNINPDQAVIHGSLLYNMRMIIWDISTDKRWQHMKNQ